MPVRVIGLVIAFALAGCAPVAPTLPPTPSTGSSPSSSPAMGWEPVGSNLGDCEVGAVVVRASGELLAICQESSLRPRVLTTRDGRTWLVREPSGIATNDPQQVPILRSLAEGPDGTLVLVGASAVEDISSGDAASWTSSDGIQWQRAGASQTLRDAEMTAVAAFEDGYLAVGGDGFPGANTQLPGLRAPAVWRSTDGTTWGRRSFARAGDRVLFEGVAAVPGGWVAWGGGPAPGSGAIWTSIDGADWKLATSQAGVRWGPIGRVASGPDGSLVAVGSKWGDGEDPMPGIWRSADGGATWADLAIDGASDLGALWDVTATAGGLVAIDAQGRVAVSSDGSHWSVDATTQLMPRATLRLLVAIPGSVIAFGGVESDDDVTSGIWRRDS